MVLASPILAKQHGSGAECAEQATYVDSLDRVELAEWVGSRSVMIPGDPQITIPIIEHS